MPDTPSLFLFVPADRPERYAGAAASGADRVIIDLEDAVAPDRKSAARAMLCEELQSAPATATPVLLRINGIGTPWHADDLVAVSSLLRSGRLAGIMLPKAEAADDIETIRLTLGPGAMIIALVESAAGLAHAEEIACAADRIAFGSIDFAADIGCDHTSDALLFARTRLVIAARVAQRDVPIDGVTRSIRDEDEIEHDARYGASLGLKAKLLIHPAQIAPARRGLSPTPADLAWAERILAGSGDRGAVSVDGQMVDAPVIARARQIRNDQDRQSNRQTR
ncbi:HpcH/HpaI aldolase/citrate lyase family protein [Hoeflea alexandrii]|uniref:HpcH/HpaI aldolase/citrate lyase family protein n=1 Tax=Hoeflea alexandrii TaxID=288436 RepID=UPI0022AF6058|nr:CoA ester lyase [Hoeflea alexandrii]MCZ4291737.1 CoA ester lyase [Hoeflea alexandrii]